MTNKLQADKIYTLPIKNGYLDIRVSTDPDYPGLDIEYISNLEKDSHGEFTRPRVLVECNENKLRTVIWGDHTAEDYSSTIEFECVDD